MVLKLDNNRNRQHMHIICVDTTNIDHSNKGYKMRDSHMEIILNNKKKGTQELMINNTITG